MPWFSILPFALLLASIAVLPLAAPKLWHANRHRAIVVACLAVPFALWMVLAYGERRWRALAARREGLPVVRRSARGRCS